MAGISLPRRLAAIELMGNTDYDFAGDTLLRLLRPAMIKPISAFAHPMSNPLPSKLWAI